MYNNILKFRLIDEQIKQDQITTFDNNFLAFEEKFNIANITKESFIIVTQIIMSARTDGQQLAWKWMQENQQIPYNEFIKFYSDLSTFTEGRYKENNSLERKRQENVKLHNFTISFFPGVIYNYFFKFERLEYVPGFVTPETKALFNQK